MKKKKFRTFQERLEEDLKNPEFRRHYKEEETALALAYKIHTLREENSLTQKELAKLMGTSQQAVSRLESGEYEGLSLKTLEKVAKATGTYLKVDFVPA
ncbi:MAG: helix-turn-helix transcriptional regulator [Deltaproteobacteria bacterium]|nr:helix-turn-helix transcriptional regulator [Deltaproteobacteria bacterium]